MPPAHVSPSGTERVVLVIEVVETVVPDQTVGVIDPIFLSREMVLRTIVFTLHYFLTSAK